MKPAPYELCGDAECRHALERHRAVEGMCLDCRCMGWHPITPQADNLHTGPICHHRRLVITHGVNSAGAAVTGIELVQCNDCGVQLGADTLEYRYVKL